MPSAMPSPVIRDSVSVPTRPVKSPASLTCRLSAPPAVPAIVSGPEMPLSVPWLDGASDETNTDWTSILSLYDQLLLLKPTPIVAMNRSVALARVRGPREALEALEAQHLYHAIRASFIAKLGHPAEARAAYQRAADLAQCDAEREFLQSQAK